LPRHEAIEFLRPGFSVVVGLGKNLGDVFCIAGRKFLQVRLAHDGIRLEDQSGLRTVDAIGLGDEVPG